MNETKQLVYPIVKAFYEWENATTSFKTQIALRNLKQLMASLKKYVEAEDPRPEQNHADGHATGSGEGGKESVDHPESAVLPAPADGEHTGAV